MLQGTRITLRPVHEDDIELLTEILQEPEVARWWGPHDEDRVRKDLLEDDEVDAFAIELEGEVIGMIQAWEDTDPDYRHAGMDIFLRTDQLSQGLGTDAVRTLARHLVDDRGHHRLVIDPDAENARAIGCYENVGFERVGVLRRYWHAPDGTWRDGLLLDLLAEDLHQGTQ